MEQKISNAYFAPEEMLGILKLAQVLVIVALSGVNLSCHNLFYLFPPPRQHCARLCHDHPGFLVGLLAMKRTLNRYRWAGLCQGGQEQVTM